MKLMKKRPEERATALKGHAREQRFQFAGREEVSETSCVDAQRWNEGDQPADVDGRDVSVAS
jgi:hypothetical protein